MPQVQAAIGASNAAAFDVTAACSGFVLALVTASQYIRTGTFKNILVVGGDALSRLVDWRDRCGRPLLHAAAAAAAAAGLLLEPSSASAATRRGASALHSVRALQQHPACGRPATGNRAHPSPHTQPPAAPIAPRSPPPTHPSPRHPAATCILFGDGCGAVVVSAAPDGQTCGLLGMSMHSDGNGQKSLNALYSGAGGKHEEEASASGRAAYSNIHMAGQDVFKFAVRSVPQVGACLARRRGLPFAWRGGAAALRLLGWAGLRRAGAAARRGRAGPGHIGRPGACSARLAQAACTPAGARPGACCACQACGLLAQCWRPVPPGRPGILPGVRAGQGRLLPLCSPFSGPAACLPAFAAQVIENALEKAGLQKEDVDWLVMHQVGRAWGVFCSRPHRVFQGSGTVEQRAGGAAGRRGSGAAGQWGGRPRWSTAMLHWVAAAG
jgi:3-oxoacyl-[acyl-carrier-protein] synthase III